MLLHKDVTSKLTALLALSNMMIFYNTGKFEAVTDSIFHIGSLVH